MELVFHHPCTDILAPDPLKEPAHLSGRVFPIVPLEREFALVLSQYRAAQGPADGRCHHRVSQDRVPLSQRFWTLPPRLGVHRLMKLTKNGLEVVS